MTIDDVDPSDTFDVEIHDHQLRNYHADRIEREWYDRLTPEAKPLHGPGRLLIVSPTHFETT